MPNPQLAFSGLMLLLAAPATPDSPGAASWGDVVAALQQHASIHVPRVTITSTTIILRSGPRLPPVTEKKAKDCVKVEEIQGFVVNDPDSVDLVLRDGKLLRARFASTCRALGFYSGFYVKPTDDKKICAKRDSFRSRSGRSCDVEGFSTLVAQR